MRAKRNYMGKKEILRIYDNLEKDPKKKGVRIVLDYCPRDLLFEIEDCALRLGVHLFNIANEKGFCAPTKENMYRACRVKGPERAIEFLRKRGLVHYWDISKYRPAARYGRPYLIKVIYPKDPEIRERR